MLESVLALVVGQGGELGLALLATLACCQVSLLCADVFCPTRRKPSGPWVLK